ncbi:hypothetical protein [Embleya sp. NPDC001921]
MIDDNIEAEPPVHTYCSAVRVTPYLDGAPGHAQALTYHFDEPATLVHITRIRHPSPGEDAIPRQGVISRAIPQAVASLITISTPYDHPQYFELGDLTDYFRGFEDGFTAVEAWSQTPVGAWLYLLYPRVTVLRPEPSHAQKDMRLHGAGEGHTARRPYEWPDPSPVPDSRPLRETRLLQATVNQPPPPAKHPRTRASRERRG